MLCEGEDQKHECDQLLQLTNVCLYNFCHFFPFFLTVRVLLVCVNAIALIYSCNLLMLWEKNVRNISIFPFKLCLADVTNS